MYRGETLAVFQRLGNDPLEKEKLIPVATTGAITGVAIRNSCELILSMPAALRGLNFRHKVSICALVIDGMT